MRIFIIISFICDLNFLIVIKIPLADEDFLDTLKSWKISSLSEKLEILKSSRFLIVRSLFLDGESIAFIIYLFWIGEKL